MNVVAVLMADYIGLILIVSMLISSRIRRKSGNDDFRIISFSAKLTAVACVVDFLAFYFDGKPGELAKLINLVANTLCFVANPLFVFSWCLYEDMKLYKSKARVRKLYKKASWPALIMAVVALVNMFIPIIFEIDAQNVYHRLPLSYLYYVVDLGYLIYSVIILKGFEDKYGKVRFFPLYLMLGPIILGCAIQAIFYGVSLIWVSMSVGLTGIYMSVQNEFSYVDTLTGLYNRAYLDYQLEISAKDKSSGIGGIMIDVDYFKQINDTMGHSTGDEALIDVARIILFSKPDKAIPIRFAGDEFIVLLKNTNENQLQKVVNDIRTELDIFNETEGRQYKLSLSLGCSMFDRENETTDEFFKHMDDNMYEEKVQKHKNR